MIRLASQRAVVGRTLVGSSWTAPSTIRPSFDSQAFTGHAGPSRLPFASMFSTSVYRSHSLLRKGKLPETAAGSDYSLMGAIACRGSHPYSAATLRSRISSRHLGQIRLFHATARREALPLIPATIGILKSTTVLAVATTIARVLISFFPLGTIATFKLSRGVRWLESSTQRPDVSPPVEEFWKMWCEGEEIIRPTKEEASQIIDGTMLPDGGCRGPNGKISYATPVHTKRFRVTKNNDDPTRIPRIGDNGKDNSKRIASFIRGTRFYLPDLPPASLPYHARLSESEQAELTKLRRYWISLKVFKHTLRWARWIMMTLLFFPFVLILGVYACGIERVPFTGRWRVVLLTPEEEDTISSNLSGANWYRSVINLLTTPEKPAPAVVPIEDWRWRWVHGVLRRLEAGALAECHGTTPPFPRKIEVPPAMYPLKPRPRVSSMLHSALPGGEPTSGKEHLEIGPPYSLMLMEKEEKNAFSYGFGGKGAGGVVVYTGLLDHILRVGSETAPQDPPPPRGFLSSLFSTPPPRPPPRMPTEMQTLHLACVLAHEMGHLLLSHHLETLSQQQVLWPSILGLTMDLTRAFIWPITFLLGPTVNDALANVGKTSTEEISERYGQIGFQWKHEYEADLVGLRLLALAGYDPHAALDHFTNSVADLHEIQPLEQDDTSFTGRLFKLWTTATHPTPEQRTEAIRAELARWSQEQKTKSKEETK